MMRTVNFALVLITAIVCLATYRIAEDARVARATLVKTERQIAREHQALVVLGAEWARVTRPQRIQALAERHLPLTDAPVIELASFSMLPHRGSEPPMPGGPLRDANIVMPEIPSLPAMPQVQEQEQQQETAPYASIRQISHRWGT
jgi:hypothetical protein